MKGGPNSFNEKQTGLGLRPDNRRCLTVILLLSSFIVFLTFARAQTGAPPEYELKVAWLKSLLEEVEWPSHGLPSRTDAFTIGVLGKNNFGDSITVLGEKTVKGRRIVIKYVEEPSECHECQVVFVSASEKERLPQILETLKRTPVLTVGEIPGFAEKGGIVNLIVRGNGIRTEINHLAAQRSGFTFSSRLLQNIKVKLVGS